MINNVIYVVSCIYELKAFLVAYKDLLFQVLSRSVAEHENGTGAARGIYYPATHSLLNATGSRKLAPDARSPRIAPMGARWY